MPTGSTLQARYAGASDSFAQEAIHAIPWLREVADATLDALAAEAMLHRLPPGSLVFEQAETPAFAQFLLAGSVELLGVREREETLIELLQPVDLVIPAAVVTGQPYLMRARVCEEAHLLLVSAETFRRAMASDPALCRATLGCVSAQFRRQVRIAKNLRLRSAEERVGCYLLTLIERHRGAGPPTLPIDKRKIASQLAMSREAFSRALASMEQFGIRVVGKTLEIGDLTTAKARFALDPLIDGVESIEPFSTTMRT